MILTPRYDGPMILSVDGDPSDQLEPITRQHRRMQAMLGGLTAEQWGCTSRCDDWSVRDVVAHLIGVNSFWRASVAAGVAGTPTRVLAGFDPAATPPLMVNGMSALTLTEVLGQFVATSEAFFRVVDELTDDGWSTVAESPAGHVPIRLLVQHALWDSWIHERDIVIPLGISPVVEPDEVKASLRYAAAVSPVLAMGLGRSCTGVFAVEATDPDVHFVLEVGDTVAVREEVIESGVPCLRGDAVVLVDALSLRAPMPPSAPIEWSQLLGGLETAFDSASSEAVATARSLES